MVWFVAGWCGLVALAWFGGLVRAVRSAHDPRYRVGPEGPTAAGDVPVSIVIPARNEEAVIEACVAGALAQDHPAVEVVVLDDLRHSDRGAHVRIPAFAHPAEVLGPVTAEDRVEVLDIIRDLVVSDRDALL